jgi:hypothetical protein
MSGGGWAYPFCDNEDNRDRIKYMRKFGHVLGGLLIEKLAEADGGSPLDLTPFNNPNFTSSAADSDAYALLAVVPFSKNIVWKPLFYFINGQGNNGAGNLQGTRARDYLIMNGLMVKAGPFKLDTEINYRWGTTYNALRDDGVNWRDDMDRDGWALWADAGFTFGPAEIALGGWYTEGEGSTVQTSSNERQGLWALGGEFQPTMLLFSENMGALFNTAGVQNGTVPVGTPRATLASGPSGYQAWYIRGAYKISDSMKLSGILAFVYADKMTNNGNAVQDMLGEKWNGRSASDEIGQELNLTFEWKFMPNLTYTMTGAYLWTGEYFDDAFGAANFNPANNVFGLYHGLTIAW